ncbi:P-type conjugative transfer protein TrbG [Methylocaldum sp. BRCS4]|uniref:P-type conjugative transfer protein TrbG n=1 Tax=Methylocaldum sp. GT1BW TaxID=3438964 RepID=UPI0012EC1932|nr:P-type conjugative transfer protein TrbG [Methylocaldum sp. BRCS4]
MKRSFLPYLLAISSMQAVWAKDLHLHGDIRAAVATVAKAHDLTVLPATGVKRSIQIDIDMPDTSATSLLREIGEQAGDKADINFSPRKRTVQIDYKYDPVPAPKTRSQIAAETYEEARKWRDGQTAAPIKGRDGLVQFPFGETQPVLTCAPLHACDIELEAGEEINNVIFGDTVRWISAPAYTGTGANKIPHVIVKPTESGLETNLIITTSRRSYTLTLKAADSNYTSRVGFYYPHDMVQLWNSQAEAKQKSAESIISDMPIMSADQLRFDYELDGDDDMSWYPVRVFSDGRHVYIQMPETMQSSEAPALVLLNAKGDSELVNYRVKGSYYIVDKLFDRAALIVGVGSGQQKVTISKKSPGLFGWLRGWFG